MVVHFRTFVAKRSYFCVGLLCAFGFCTSALSPFRPYFRISASQTLVRSGASQPWDGRGAAAGGPGPCTGLASSLVPAVAPVRAACLHSVINSGGQLTCSKLTRGRLFRGGHVDPCQVRGPACGAE